MNKVHWPTEVERKPLETSSMRECVIIGGSSHPDLVHRICKTLDIEPIPLDSKNFSNGETAIAINESVRDKDVFVIQSSHGEVNDYLMELLIVVSALKIASAKSVTAVLPIFPYSRQLDAASAVRKAVNNKSSSEQRERERSQGSLVAPNLQLSNEPPVGGNSPRKASTFGEETRVRLPSTHSDQIRESPLENSAAGQAHGLPQETTKHATLKLVNGGGKYSRYASESLMSDYNSGMRSWVAQNGSLVASLLATAGADHVITMDLHDPQYQGFFDVPFDNLLFRPLLIEYIQTVIPSYHSAVIVSPDAGGAKRATQVADQLHTRFALIHQDRRNTATILVGDVNDRVAILIDDLIDSGKTLIRAARILKDHGAIQVVAICTHGLLSGDTVYKIRDSAIDRIVTTNSIPQDKHIEVLGDRLHVVDVSILFAEAIRRIYNGESISRLYKQVPLNI